jgi:hypothetical protein
MKVIELRKLARLSSASGYNDTNKKEFARLSRKLLRELNEIFGRQVSPPFAGQATADVRYNAGGIAVSGDATLHGDSIYVQISGIDLGILYRTCNGRKDYSGGRNNWYSWGMLIERGVEGLAQAIVQLLARSGASVMALNGPNAWLYGKEEPEAAQLPESIADDGSIATGLTVTEFNKRARRKKVHFHSSDSRFCGSTEKGRQFTTESNDVTCPACQDKDTLTLTPQGREYVESEEVKENVRRADSACEGDMSDFSVRNEGNIFLLTPNTPDAREWIEAHIPDDAQHFGVAVVVEHRYIADIVAGIQSDGLAVR